MTAPTKNGFFNNEPQVVQGLVLWLLTQVGALILGHTSLVTSDQWSSLTTALVPIISALVIGVVTFTWRRWLSPAWKIVQADINKVPFGPEVEALIEAKVEQYLQQLEGKLPSTAPVAQEALPPGVYNGQAQAG